MNIQKLYTQCSDDYCNYITKQTLDQYYIRRNTTYYQTMIQVEDIDCFSFDFSKFYWHVIHVLIQNNFPQIYTDINDAFINRYGVDFPTTIPSAEDKLTVNSFIGCLSSKQHDDNHNPFDFTDYGLLIRKLGLQVITDVIKQLQRRYDISVLGGNTDGFYFTAENIDIIKDNFTHIFAYKLTPCYHFSSSKTSYFGQMKTEK